VRELSDLANEAWPEQPEDGLIRAREAASLSRGDGSGGRRPGDQDLDPITRGEASRRFP
jgi:hypothetical protein